MNTGENAEGHDRMRGLSRSGRHVALLPTCRQRPHSGMPFNRCLTTYILFTKGYVKRSFGNRAAYGHVEVRS